MGCLHFVGKVYNPYATIWPKLHTCTYSPWDVYGNILYLCSQLGCPYSRKLKEDHICFEYLKILPVEFGVSLYVVLKAQKIRTNWL